MDKKPLLSIVVPTKNRYKYLKYLIELVAQFQSDEIELVIQDNSDSNSEFLIFLQTIDKKNIIYNYNKGKLSVSENATLSILNSSGDYVCFIGDDDGFCNSIIKIVKYMKSHNIDALISKQTIYDWPDFIDNSIYHLSATLQYKDFSEKITYVNPDKEISKCVNSGLRDLHYLPRVYQGIVSRKYLDLIYDKNNTFFPGPSPDMANAISLALLSPKMVRLDAPLIISGQSKTVGGGERLLGKKNLPNIKDVPFLPSNIEEIWDERLPAVWCADTIWPQSAISAFKAMDVELPKINFNRIMATFIFDHPFYYGKYKRHINSHIEFAYFFIRCFFEKGFRFVYWHLSYILSGRKKRAGVFLERNLINIYDAACFLNQKLKSDVRI